MRNIRHRYLGIDDDIIEQAFKQVKSVRDNARMDDGRGDRHVDKRMRNWRYYIRRLVTEQPFIREIGVGIIKSVDTNRKTCVAIVPGMEKPVDNIKYYPPNKPPKVGDRHTVHFEVKLPTKTVEEDSKLEEVERWIRILGGKWLYYIDSTWQVARVPWPPPENGWEDTDREEIANLGSLDFDRFAGENGILGIDNSTGKLYFVGEGGTRDVGSNPIRVAEIDTDGEIEDKIIDGTGEFPFGRSYVIAMDSQNDDQPKITIMHQELDQDIPIPGGGVLINVFSEENEFEHGDVFGDELDEFDTLSPMMVVIQRTFTQQDQAPILFIETWDKLVTPGPIMSWIVSDDNGESRFIPVPMIDWIAVGPYVHTFRDGEHNRQPDPNPYEFPGMPKSVRLFMSVNAGKLREVQLPANPIYGAQDSCRVIVTPGDDDILHVYATFTPRYPWPEVGEAGSVNRLYKCEVPGGTWKEVDASIAFVASRDGVDLIGRAGEYSNAPYHSTMNPDNSGHQPRWVYSIDSGEKWQDMPRPPGISSMSWNEGDGAFLIVPTFAILEA